jgi:virulence factor Mce-like protein
MMTSRQRYRRTLTIVLAALAVVAAIVAVRHEFFGPNTITADFTSATGIYPGDDVRVAGVKVGTISAIQPGGGTVRITMKVRHSLSIPADAKAVLVAQNLIAARYVQLAPAYESNGPLMSDGANIPVNRTAVPVEWDEVKRQLMRLATDLGPQAGVKGTAVSRFIDSAAGAMAGNGDKLRQTLSQLSQVGRVLADGSTDIVDILKNLQIFVATLRNSNEQIVEFQDRLATLTSVVDNSRTDLDAMLDSLSVAVGDVQRFVAETRDKTAQQLSGLVDITNNLVDHKIDLENILHVAPNALANQMNMYNPVTGSAVGAFVLNNLSDPVSFVCGTIGAIENTTASETAKNCAQYLGPALKTLNMNYLPIPLSPFLTTAPDSDQVVYSEPRLAPGGEGPKGEAPQMPPAVSAYSGAPGDATPPSAPPPPDGGLPQLLMPAERPAS